MGTALAPILPAPFQGTSGASTAVAADPAWTTPTRPPECTVAQVDAGNVAGCVILLRTKRPEYRGWSVPPFPEATPGEVLPWVDLSRGATGFVVSMVQKALNLKGASVVVDGQFGLQTESAVKTYQSRVGLSSTGVVNNATADSLGVQNTTYTFPPAGWSWLGWGYNGSTQLASWERALASNTAAFGAVRLGALRTPPAALPLFEGFLREIQARGYVLSGGTGSYVFRCTATTRKDCAGLDRDALSNHAYGLATDISTLANPLKVYYGVNGTSACQTPMQTDIPRWVVQVAEKWGLYWGGYGWSSGCLSPSEFKTSALRDPMHFEFNGTPAQATAIARFNQLGAGGPCLQLADSAGTISTVCLAKGAMVPAGSRLVVATAPPAGATAVTVNITTIGGAAGTVVAESCAARSGARPTVTGQIRASRAVAAATAVPIDAQGRFCVLLSAAAHVIVDVQGFFSPPAAAPTAALYYPTTPRVTVDSRTTVICLTDGTCLAPGTVPGGSRVMSLFPTSREPVAVVASVATTGSTDATAMSALSCAAMASTSSTSSLNAVPGEIVANMAVVATSASDLGGQFCTRTGSAAHHLVEIHGEFAAPVTGGLAFTPLAPARLVDTRSCWTDPSTGAQRCNQPLAAGSTLRLRAPTGAQAVMVAVTASGSTAAGFAKVRRCGTTGSLTAATVPTTWVPAGGTATANVVVPVESDGTICVVVSTSMHVAVDAVGSFSTTGALRYLPASPRRLIDTRLA